jgi:hypothetical protein
MINLTKVEEDRIEELFTKDGWLTPSESIEYNDLIAKKFEYKT